MPKEHTSDGRVFRHPYDVALGAVLREVREELGLSRTTVQDRTNRRIKIRDLDDWENGRRGMRVHTVGELCAVYDVKTSAVLDCADRRHRAAISAGAAGAA